MISAESDGEKILKIGQHLSFFMKHGVHRPKPP